MKNKGVIHPLLSWDIIADRRIDAASQENLKSLLMLKKQFNWDMNIPSVLKNHFDVIVVTDIDETIVWASKGFEQMTGYKVSFAKSKKPSFLHGINTDLETRKRIRAAIRGRQPIKETLINYRKNGNEYHCRVEITPLYTTEKILTHFMALESEVN